MSVQSNGSVSQSLESRALALGADLVLEGGGVKGIGLVGAVTTLAAAGYVFPRVGGTSAGAIVAALVAAYQTAHVPLSQIETDMKELDYTKFMDSNALEKALGPLGQASALLMKQGVYSTGYLNHWLHGKLDPIGIHTFADLKIDGDDASSLTPVQRYRLVVHVTDVTRQRLVRLPWDVPRYRLPEGHDAPFEAQVAAIDAYPVVDAVQASMSIPFFFQPFRQDTPEGACTWVDGGLLQDYPVTVFDRTDGQPPRWPTFGVKLNSAPPTIVADRPATNDVSELLAIAHTALGQWNGYAIQDDGHDQNTIWVDTFGVPTTDFTITSLTQSRLFANGTVAARMFLDRIAKIA